MGILLAAVVALLYSNTLHGPFLFDDFLDIRDNPTIRHLWPLQDIFLLPGNGLRTRPVVNLTFALNYAMGGLNPFPYHLTNLLIHVGATLALFGALRRAFLLPSLRDRFGRHALTLAVVIAGLWGMHPLLTEAVSYTVQRYESLMAMLVLLTFYCVLRTADSPAPGKWMGLASLSCLLALGSKEVAVSLPILVLLFDRTFLAGSFREALRRRGGLYVGLLVAWACFALLQIHPVHRSFAGQEVGLPWWKYALNQANVILHYLRLSVWPSPLVFDYFWPVAKTWTQLVPGVCVIGSLLGLTVWGLVRRPKLAFLPTCFFLILAPTSSVMPILDLAVEHRMYLPLVPVVIVLVLVLHSLFGKLEAKLGQA
ncbi:MAG TPA: hypothetical protein VN436_18070, partial [Holophaga sp.]|nr:hypothetical protein [Holophaga sp.]